MLKISSTVITKILKGEIDKYYYLEELGIEGNPYLTYLEPGLFKNMSNLEKLSISYNRALQSFDEGTFEGLTSLRNLTLVDNIFHHVEQLASLLKPIILPSLKGLDISKNPLKGVSENAFIGMKGTPLDRLEINQCSLDNVHPNSFLPLTMLQELHISQNDLNASLIVNFLQSTWKNGINLTYIDLSEMGFKKEPPRELMVTVSLTTIAKLILADNHFESIPDDAFPTMINIEVLDLSRVSAMFIGINAFDSIKFPNLKVLLLSGNYFKGMYQTNRPGRNLLVLDLSNNRVRSTLQNYYLIDKNTFLNFKHLRVLNLSYNSIKTIYNYTFYGLGNLRTLNLENSTLFVLGERTFKSVPHLKLLNLANNYFGRIMNLTSNIFEGLGELKILSMASCGISRFIDSDNIFENMPNLTALVLRKNLLRFITPELMKPLKHLQVLDLSENMLMSWPSPLFLPYGVRPTSLYLSNNKITQFNVNMLLDIDFLYNNPGNITVNIDFMNNVFVCDCTSMYKTYTWLELNGSVAMRDYFNKSMFLCDSPDNWQDKRVVEYLESISNTRCPIYESVSNMILLAWSAPALVTIFLILFIAAAIYKYRIYIRYWIFLSKVALGKKFIRRKSDASRQKDYEYDAFVSYSNEDKDFVAKMVSHLESDQPHVKLCIYERDFEIGSFISESVSNSINESRYVILVVSNNFAKSQWCRWETHLAEYHRLFLEDGTTYDPLILIKIGEVESRYLTTSLKYLLKTKIYHTWNEQQSEEFWTTLKNVLRKRHTK